MCLLVLSTTGPHYFDDVHREQIQRDWRKIKGLFTKLEDQNATGRLFCFFVIFNKGSATCLNFESFLSANRSDDNHRILYRCGGVF